MEMTLNIDVVEQSGSPMIRFAIGGNAVVLNVNEIEDLVAWIAKCRSGMLPAVSNRPLNGAIVAAENNPHWDIKRDPQLDGALLMLRHSGFGWLGFVMSELHLTQLDNAIQRADTQQSEIQPRNRLN